MPQINICALTSGKAVDAMDRKLPEDIIEEVALRLPSKSVGRFRCASKVWRSRLSSSTFVRAHFNLHIHTTAPVSIFFMNHDYHYSDYPPRGYLLSFPANGGLAKLVASPLFQGHVSASAAFRGLVVVEIETENVMFLFNPITKEALELPRFRPSNPYECRHFLGFGYDSSSEDYKIVRLSYSEHHYGRKYDGTFVDVYSFKTKSWRKLKKSPYRHELNLPDPCPGVLVNGCLHWLACGKDGWSGSCIIAAFDLAGEKFQQVPPPKGSDDGCKVVHVSDDDSYGEEGSDDSHEEEGSDDDSYGEEGSEDSYEEEGFGDSSRVVEGSDDDCFEEEGFGVSSRVVEGSDDDSFEEEGCDDSCEEEDFDDSCEAFEGFDNDCHLLVLGGCLAVVFPPSDDDCIDVWVMREYGVRESWNKLVIDTKGRHIGKFVYLSREDELVFSQFDGDTDVFIPYSLSFAAYSLSTRVWRDIVVHGTQYDSIDNEDEAIGVVAYTECLLSPNHILD